MAPYSRFLLRGEYAKLAVVSRNVYRADDDRPEHVDAVPSGRCPMAHQFDSVCGNGPTPQIMIQLIGCRIEPSPQVDDSKQLNEAST